MEGLDRGLGLVLDCGFRRNDGGLGTACCAPTALDSGPVAGDGTCLRGNDGRQGVMNRAAPTAADSGGVDSGLRRDDGGGGGLGGGARFIAPLRRRGAGGVLATDARYGGGATPRAGRNLDGRLHVMGGQVG